jgi:hypothetical protein
MKKRSMGCRSCQFRVGVVLALLTWIAVAHAQTAPTPKPTGEPIKLSLKSMNPIFRVGEQPILAVSALDASGRASPVWKDFPVDILAGPGPDAQKVSYTILKKGNAAIEVPVPPQQQPGLFYFEARNPELLSSGTFIDIRAAAEPAPGPGARRSSVPLAVALRISPRREFLADRTDAATIQAFLTSAEAAPADVTISLSVDGGTLDPDPLVIPRGQSKAEAAVTAAQPGDCTIRVGAVRPQASIDADAPFRIRFVAPAVRLNVKSNTTEVTLFDTPVLTVELVDTKGTPVVLEKPRTVSISLSRGRGVIDQTKLEIPAGASSASTTLHPSWFGELIVGATVPGMSGMRVFLPVIPPYQQLSLAFFVGIVGGSLVLIRRRGMPLWRVAIGGLLGFIFYWACLWWGLPVVPRTLLLHPVCVMLLSALGGWAGTSLYAAVLRPVDEAYAGRSEE